MVPWDDDKSTAADPDNPSANEQLSADEWDAHVADQKGHSTRHESGGSDEIGLGNLSLPAGAQIDEESGDFVVRDSGGNVALRYDEASGAWQLDALEAESVNTDRANISQTSVRLLNSDTTVSIANATFVGLEFDTEDFAHTDIYSIDLSQNAVTVQESGTYQIRVALRWEDNNDWSDGDRCQLVVEVNDSQITPRIHDYWLKNGTGREDMVGSLTQALSANDKVSVLVSQFSGSEQTVDSSARSTYITIDKIG